MAEEHKEQKTKFYRVKHLPPIEQKGQLVSRNPRFAGTEQGEAGDVMELTPNRMKSLGEQYFEELTTAQHKEWEDSGRTKKFLGLDKK